MWILATALAMAPPVTAGRIDLVCLGAGSANKQTSTSVYGSDNYGNSG